MDTRSEPLADEPQPGNAGMSGFRHRSLHVEMKDRFRTAGALLGQPPPASVAHSHCALAAHAVANKVDVDVLVCRPMPLEVIEESGPIRFQAMRLCRCIEQTPTFHATAVLSS